MPSTIAPYATVEADIEIRQYTDEYLYPTFETGSSEAGYSAVDFTGAEIFFTVSETPGATPIYELTSTPDTGITIPSAGNINIHMSDTNNALLIKQGYFYELAVKWSDGIIELLMQGRVVVDLGLASHA